MCEVPSKSSSCKTQEKVSTNDSGCVLRMSCHPNLYSISRKTTRSPRVSASVVWLCYAFIICYCSFSCLADSDSVITTEAPLPTTYIPKPPVFNILDCKNSFDSSDQEKYICLRHQDLFPILKYAEQLAKKTCEEAFQHELWNCTGFSLLKQPNVTKGDDVFKESAYVYALSLAVITHSVARGCAQNIVNNCSCLENATECTDNVEYGLTIAETFLNKRYTNQGANLKQELAQHNFRAAKLIIHQVMNSTKKTCHCHGISGSCTFSICHSELPSFEQVAHSVKKAYENSCRVTSTGHSQNQWVSQCNRDFTETDLIFRDFGNWCMPNPSIGSVGVLGRECSPHQDAPNSCNKLCYDECGRYSQSFVEVQDKQCECTFLFCCEIECDTCTDETTLFRCI